MAKNMPYNLEAEQSVLASILLDQVIQLDVISALSEEDFLVESHKIIFGCMREVMLKNVPVDLVTLADMLQKNGKLEKVGANAQTGKTSSSLCGYNAALKEEGESVAEGVVLAVMDNKSKQPHGIYESLLFVVAVVENYSSLS